MFTAAEYIRATALGSAIFLLALSPIAVAAIVAWLPGSRPRRKWLFSIVCGVLAYGSAVLAEVLVVPFDLVATFLAPSWEDAGYTVVPAFFATIARNSFWFSGFVGVVVTFGAPVYIRKNIWPKITADAA